MDKHYINIIVVLYCIQISFYGIRKDKVAGWPGALLTKSANSTVTPAGSSIIKTSRDILNLIF